MKKQKNQFSKLLQYYLKSKNLSQKDLSQYMGYEKSTVSCWCNGSRVPKLDVIIDIAEFLCVNPGDLIMRDRNLIANPDSYSQKITYEIKTNPELQQLFQLTQDASTEDLELYIDLIKRIQKRTHNMEDVSLE